jgi:hypothetical protein
VLNSSAEACLIRKIPSALGVIDCSSGAIFVGVSLLTLLSAVDSEPSSFAKLSRSVKLSLFGLSRWRETIGLFGEGSGTYCAIARDLSHVSVAESVSLDEYSDTASDNESSDPSLPSVSCFISASTFIFVRSRSNS